MTATAEPDWEGLVRPFVEGRRIVLTGGPLAAFTDTVAWLQRLGSGPVLVVGSGVGTGPLPAPGDAEQVVVEVHAPDPVAEFRAFEQAMADPPREVRQAIEDFDPEGEALLLVAPVQSVPAVLGRPAFGGRHPDWVALEDKTTVDAFLDAAGVERPPSEVVPAARDPLLRAAATLDRGDGTVWAGDAREGFNGGALYVRWVHTDDPGAADEALSLFSDSCDRVRVAPFLEGVPCSIHGVVLDDGVAVFRPAEMVTLRQGRRFRYAGVATFWDPAPPDRELMRSVARRVGELLSERVGFRGCFGVDGVMTADGFLPTEVNPRFGGGMATIAKGLSDRLPLVLLHHAVVEHPSLVPAAVLEEHLTAAADGCRAGGAWLLVERCWEASEEHPLVLDGPDWRTGSPGEAADAVLHLGPGASGGFVRVALDGGRTPVGPPVGPRLAAALDVADRTFGTGTGGLTAATSVR